MSRLFEITAAAEGEKIIAGATAELEKIALEGKEGSLEDHVNRMLQKTDEDAKVSADAAAKAQKVKDDATAAQKVKDDAAEAQKVKDAAAKAQKNKDAEAQKVKDAEAQKVKDAAAA